MISSPCLRKCWIGENDRCVACNRTLKQIREWSTYTETKRKEIMKTL